MVAYLVATAVIDALHTVDVHEDDLCLVEVAQHVLVGNPAKALEPKSVEEPRELVAHIQIVQT